MLSNVAGARNRLFVLDDRYELLLADDALRHLLLFVDSFQLVLCFNWIY